MDRKRVNGPELSVVPVEEHTEVKKIFDSKEKRLDGRGIDDIRPICKFSTKCISFILEVVFNNDLGIHSHEVGSNKSSQRINLYGVWKR